MQPGQMPVCYSTLKIPKRRSRVVIKQLHLNSLGNGLWKITSLSYLKTKKEEKKIRHPKLNTIFFFWTLTAFLPPMLV